MKTQAARVAVLFIEITAIFVAVLAACAAYLVIRLQHGPVSLDSFRQSAAFAIERRLPKGYDATIGGLDLIQDQEHFALRLTGVGIVNAAGEGTASADLVELVFETRDMFDRRVGPETVKAVGARFRIVRNAEQTVKVPAARGRGGRSLFPSSDQVIGSGFLKSAFASAEIEDAVVTFVDEASGRAWTSQNASIVLNRTANGLTGVMSGDIDLGGESRGHRASLRADGRYRESDGVISIDVAGERFPVGDILSMFFGDRAAVIEAPVSGQGAIELTRDGRVRASAFSAKIGAGALRLAGANAPIEFIEWKSGFDPTTDQFTIDHFAYDVAGNKGEADGTVALEFDGDIREPKNVLFDLNARELVVDLPGRLDKPIAVADASFAGNYDIVSRKFELSDFSAALLDIVIDGAFSITAPRVGDDGKRPSPGVTADVSVDGYLDPERLLRIWPLGVAMGARDWIEDRMDGARISNIKGTVSLEPGAIDADGLAPDDAVNLTFDVANAKAYYVKQMTPLSDANGSGVLRGNSFSLTVDSGRVGDVVITEGQVEFPNFIPKWDPTYYRFLAKGRSEAILGILDEAPMRLLSKTNLSPEQFQGDAAARVEIMRPNKRDVASDQYEYRGEATFENMTITGFGVEDSKLVGATGTVSLKPRSLTVKGDATLIDAPVNLVWTKNFFAEDGPSELVLAGDVDASVGDFFGLSLRNLFGGKIAASARAVGEFGAFQTLELRGDFENAWVRLGLFNWEKPAGSPATGELTMRIVEDGIDIERFAVDGDGVSVTGIASMRNGLLETASFPVIFLDGAADLSLTARRSAVGALDVTATGAYLNAGPAVLEFTKGESAPGTQDMGAQNASGEKSNPWGAGIAVTARVEQLELRKNVVYQDASFDLRRGPEALETLNFSALNEDGAPLRVTMAETGADDGPTQRIDVQSSNLGRFLKGVTGLLSMQGGEGSMAVYYGGETTGLTGELEARNMHVVNVPLLARIFSAGSLDGLANLMQGEGIDLSYAYGKFDYDDSAVTLRDFRATGPSVGMTASGVVSFAPEGDIALSGAVAPVYQLNAMLGATPIIGDLLVGRKGEGVLALSYSVNGARTAPNVVVNPLSALTPGILRQLFEAGAPPENAAPATNPIEPNQPE